MFSSLAFPIKDGTFSEDEKVAPVVYAFLGM